MLRTHSINLQLVEALLEMLGYAKLMKDLVTMKRSMDFTIKDSHNFSAIITSDDSKKKNIWGDSPSNAVLVCFNLLISNAIYKKNGLGKKILNYADYYGRLVDQAPRWDNS